MKRILHALAVLAVVLLPGIGCLAAAGPPPLDPQEHIAKVTDHGEAQPDGWYVHYVLVQGHFTRVRMPMRHFAGDSIKVRRRLTETDRLAWEYLETIETFV